LTYEIVGAGQFVKWSRDSRLDLAAEAARLRWAVKYVPVPRVLAAGRDGGEEWLLTAALPGQSAVAERGGRIRQLRQRPSARACARLHDRLPVAGCPFSWSVETRLARVNKPVELSEPPPIDRLVVCHGDACSPNTLIDDAGKCSGHVDFGEMGVADRWRYRDRDVEHRMELWPGMGRCRPRRIRNCPRSEPNHVLSQTLEIT